MRIGGNGPARDRLDDTRGIPQAIENRRSMPEQRHVLLEINADATEENAFPADAGLVIAHRRVHRNQGDVVTLRHQLRGQRIIAQTTAAIHIGSAGGDGENLHSATNSHSC